MWIEPQTCSAGVVPVSFSYLEPRVMSHSYSGVSSVFVSSFPLCSFFGLTLPPDQVYKICSLYVARVSEYRTSHQQTFGVQNTFHPFLQALSYPSTTHSTGYFHFRFRARVPSKVHLLGKSPTTHSLLSKHLRGITPLSPVTPTRCACQRQRRHTGFVVGRREPSLVAPSDWPYFCG
jgi:hypothetical protein